MVEGGRTSLFSFHERGVFQCDKYRTEELQPRSKGVSKVPLGPQHRWLSGHTVWGCSPSRLCCQTSSCPFLPRQCLTCTHTIWPASTPGALQTELPQSLSTLVLMAMSPCIGDYIPTPEILTARFHRVRRTKARLGEIP